jgi:hypothetical protein
MSHTAALWATSGPTGGNQAAWLGFAAIVSAAVIGGPIMWLLNRWRQENSTQHGIGVSLIMALIDEVKELKHRFDHHVAEEHDLFEQIRNINGGCQHETSQQTASHDETS